MKQSLKLWLLPLMLLGLVSCSSGGAPATQPAGSNPPPATTQPDPATKPAEAPVPGSPCSIVALDDVNKMVAAGYEMTTEGASCKLTNANNPTIWVTTVAGAEAISDDLRQGVPAAQIKSIGDLPVPGAHLGAIEDPPTTVAYAPAKGTLVVVAMKQPGGDADVLQLVTLDVLESVVKRVG